MSESVRKGFEYIELDIDKLMGNVASVEEVLYAKDLTDRRMYLSSDITTDSVMDVISAIIRFNAEDADKGRSPEERQPIVLFIMSNGGYVDDGYALVDIIKSSKTPVYTVNLGYWYSMALLIGMSGHKRYATQHAKFLMHDGSILANDSMSKVQDQLEFQRKMNERTKRYVVENSDITEEEYDEKYRFEWYLFADEAKEKGVIDAIIGKDIELESLIG